MNLVKCIVFAMIVTVSISGCNGSTNGDASAGGGLAGSGSAGSGSASSGSAGGGSAGGGSAGGGSAGGGSAGGGSAGGGSAGGGSAGGGSAGGGSAGGGSAGGGSAGGGSAGGGSAGGGSADGGVNSVNNIQSAFSHNVALMPSGVPASYSLSGNKFTHPQPNMSNGSAFHPNVIASPKPNNGYATAWLDSGSQAGQGGIVFTEFNNDNDVVSTYRLNPKMNIGNLYLARDLFIGGTVYGKATVGNKKRTDIVTDKWGQTLTVKGTVFGGRFQLTQVTSKNLHFSGCSLFYHRDDVATAKNNLSALNQQIQSSTKPEILAKHLAAYTEAKKYSQLKSKETQEAYSVYNDSLNLMTELELKTHYNNQIVELLSFIDLGVVEGSKPENRFITVKAVQVGKIVTYDTSGYLKCEPYYNLYQKKSPTIIQGSITKLLGFTVMDDGNYAVAYSYGQNGMGSSFFNDAPREKTVIRIMTPDGTLIKEKVVLGLAKPSEHKSRYNTLALASSRLASGNGQLSLHVATQRNVPGQGEHQGGWVGIFDKELNQLNGDAKTALGYHNMDQRLMYDKYSQRFVASWTSDGGAGLVLGGFHQSNLNIDGRPSADSPVTKLFQPEKKPATSTTNYTYAQLGQTVALGANEYASIFTAALKTESISSNYNLFFWTGKLDGYAVDPTQGKPHKLIQLTNYTDAGRGNTGATMNGTNIINAKMVPLAGNLLVIYQKVLKDQKTIEGTYTLLIDKEGNVIQSAAPLVDNNSLPVHISRSAEPIVLNNGNVVWVIGRTNSASELNIYSISGAYK